MPARAGEGWLTRLREHRRSTPLRALVVLGVAGLTLTALASNAAAVIVRGSNGRLVAVAPIAAGGGASAGYGGFGPGSGAKVSYHGGPVVHSSEPFLVYWAPSGDGIAARSRALLERYLTDAADDSGKSDDVFGVARQYYDRAGFADYRQTFDPGRQVVLDSWPYPARDVAHCPHVSAPYPTCVTDDQLRAELKRLIAANGLPTAGSPSKLSAEAPVYFVVLPGDVNICAAGGLVCADANMCAYHADFALTHGGTVVYAAVPFLASRSDWGSPKICQDDDTAAAQEPNGDSADVLVGLLSHEYSETITDPIIPTGWSSLQSGNEVGDDCQMAGPADTEFRSNPKAYKPVLGGSASAGTLFDQSINGDPYYTQSEWSNGDGTCEMNPSRGKIVPRITAPRGRFAARTSFRFSASASTSRNPYSSATWSFGDGSRSSFFRGRTALTPATHTYAAPGRYIITLTLVDDRGNVQTTAQPVTVLPAECVVPNVKRESRRRSSEAIRAARCAVGEVRTPRRRSHKRWKLVVAHQSPSAGTVRPTGTRVRLTLVYEPVRNSTRPPRASRRLATGDR